MVDWVKARTRSQMLLAFFFCFLLGAGLALIIGRTAPLPYWIIYCGNTQGGGECEPDFANAGWISAGNYTVVQWQAAIEQGTGRETDAAMPAGHAAYDAHCKGGRECIIAGFSLGNDPAIQLSSEVGLPPRDTYIFGGPQPSTGIYHSYYLDNPIVAFWADQVGNLKLSRPTKPGMHAYFDVKDPFANIAPQCNAPWSVNGAGHYIVNANSSFHVWTGPDGVVMYEVGYQPPPALPLSGADPSPPWAGCPASGWYNKEGEIPAPIPGGTGPGNPSAVPSAVPTSVPGLPVPTP